MSLPRYFARLAAIPILLAGLAPAIAAGAIAPAASAAPLAAPDGWVRIAHLSPEAPAMDMYLYPFGDPARPTVLRDVSYGDVSAYMALPPGEYSVAMRGFDAPASSRPALVSSFMVGAKTAYTMVAMGPDPGLRVEVLKDQLTVPHRKTLVRVVQASLKESRVTVSYGSTLLTSQLAFSSVTPFKAVSPGSRPMKVTAAGEHVTMSLGLAADTAHTIVVLDGSSGLKVDDLTDAVGIKTMPKGGPATGFGGMAPRSPADLTPWLLLVAGGVLVAGAGAVGLGRPRRRRRSPARGHALS